MINITRFLWSGTHEMKAAHFTEGARNLRVWGTDQFTYSRHYGEGDHRAEVTVRRQPEERPNATHHTCQKPYTKHTNTHISYANHTLSTYTLTTKNTQKQTNQKKNPTPIDYTFTLKKLFSFWPIRIQSSTVA